MLPSQFMGILCLNWDRPGCLLAFKILAVERLQFQITIAKVAAANIVPHSYAPNIKNNDQLQQDFKEYQQPKGVVLDETPSRTVSTHPVLTPERKGLLFSKINLDGITEWSEELKGKN